MQKVRSFTVGATMVQSIRWQQASEREGYTSVESWAADALDVYLKVRAKAGLPLPLVWHWGRFRVTLEDGTTPEMPGWVSPPFGIFHGNGDGPKPPGSRTLVYLPGRRIVATLRYARNCQALAAELAGVWARSGGEEGDIRAGPLIERHEREAM